MDETNENGTFKLDGVQRAPISYEKFLEIQELDPKGVVVMLPLEAISQPTVLPVDTEEVKSLVYLIDMAYRANKDGQSYNGLIDPIWIFCLDDGCLHIANGFHRFVASQELSASDSGIKPEIYAYVRKGTQQELWEARITAAGTHSTVAPARFMVFAAEAFKQTSLGRQITFTAVTRYLGSEEQGCLTAADQLGVDRGEFLNIVRLIKRQALATGISFQDADAYAQLSVALHPALLDRLRINSHGEGEVPITVARAIGNCETLCRTENQELHLMIVDLILKHKLGVSNGGRLIKQIEKKLSEGQLVDVEAELNNMGLKNAATRERRQARSKEALREALEQAAIEALIKKEEAEIRMLLALAETYAVGAVVSTHTETDRRQYHEIIRAILPTLPELFGEMNVSLNLENLQAVIDYTRSKIMGKTSFEIQQIRPFVITLIKDALSSLPKKDPLQQQVVENAMGIPPEQAILYRRLLEVLHGIEYRISGSSSRVISELQAEIKRLMGEKKELERRSSKKGGRGRPPPQLYG